MPDEAKPAVGARRRARMGLIGAFIAQAFKAKMDYRADFWTGNVFMAFMMASQILFIFLVFGQVHEVQGWTLWQVMLVYGISSSVIALAQLLSIHVAEVGEHIRGGTFDSLLIRPIPPLVHLFIREVNDYWLVTLVGRLGITALAFVNCGLADVWWNWPVLAGFILAGTAIIVAVNVVFAGLSFRVLQVETLYWFFVGEFYNLSYYPLTIYGGWIQGLLTWVFPLAWVSVVPASWFLQKGGMYEMLAVWLPVVLVFFTVLAAVLWRTGVRRYESTGS
jgi:ABC-2 type transport system permease protein